MNLRLLALTGVVACAVALPLAVASAGQVGEGRRTDVREKAAVREEAARVETGAQGESGVRDEVAGEDGKAADPTGSPSSSPWLLGLGLATAARCGPELTSPEGIEAQTCVLTQGEDTWARTYYRNVTGGGLDSVLSFMGPGGRTVQMRCAVGADDEPGTCETPRERTQGEPGAYTAVAEFARRGGQGPLLLRSGSNSGTNPGSNS